MADDIDLANAIIDSEVSRALSKIRHQSTVTKELVENCVECGEVMPVARQQLGFSICVSCAEYAERKRSRFAD